MTPETETDTSFDNMDPLAIHVFNNLDREILRGLSKNQIDAIGESIAKQARSTHHTLDLRGLIPMFFANFYFVILFGRDRRSKYDAAAHQRRQKADNIASMILLVSLSFSLLLLLAVLLYLVKMALGINLISNFHLPDLLMKL